MPRYFFHIFTNGTLNRDERGTELNTYAQVELEAMRVLPEIAKDEVPLDGNHQTFTALVTDEARPSDLYGNADVRRTSARANFNLRHYRRLARSNPSRLSSIFVTLPTRVTLWPTLESRERVLVGTLTPCY